MAVSSMTGFARSDGHAKGLSWFWEIKSGNSRSLDVRCRLPQGFEGLEFDVKSIAQTKFHRGSLQVNLEINRDSGSQIRVNEMALAQVMALVKSLRKKHKLPAPTIEGLLSIRGVLETVEPDFDEKAVVARNRLLLGALDQSFEMLVKHRRAEGAHLKEIMLGHIARIRTLAEAARDCRGRRNSLIDCSKQDAVSMRIVFIRRLCCLPPRATCKKSSIASSPTFRPRLSS
jgi:uncharacterized protein (TIGR00255 family)